jgi:hypothetical protein
MLQFLVRQLPLNEELMQPYLKILEQIESLFSNLFKLFEFLFKMSFPRTEGSFSLILYLILLKLVFQEDNYQLEYIYIQLQKKQIDVAAGVCLNDQVATGARFDNEFEKAIETIDVVINAELSELFIQHVQSKTGWTNLQYAIQTLQHKCPNICHLISEKSWHGTQCNFVSLFDRSQLSKPLKATSQFAGTCTDCIAQIENVESHTSMCSTSMSKFREGCYHLPNPVETLGVLFSTPGGALT